MKHIKILLFSALVVLLFTAGCNLFGFANPSGSSTSNLADGQRKYWDGDFDGAAADFAKAIENDSSNAEAYWWHAKALLRATGYTAISLITAMSEINTDTQVEIPLPFMNETEWPDEEANSLYQAMFGIKKDLAKIYYGEAQSDELDRDAAALDFASTLTIHMALTFRDTNTDSIINETDFNLNDLIYFLNDDFTIDSTIWDELSEEEIIDLAETILDNFDEFNSVIIELLEEEIEGIDIPDLDSIMDLIQIEVDSLLADTTGGN